MQVHKYQPLPSQIVTLFTPIFLPFHHHLDQADQSHTLPCPLHNPKSQLVLPSAWKKKRTEERRERFNQRSSKLSHSPHLALFAIKESPQPPSAPHTQHTHTQAPLSHPITALAREQRRKIRKTEKEEER